MDNLNIISNEFPFGYLPYTFPLNVARQDFKLFCGIADSLVIVSIDNINANIHIKFDSNQNKPIPIKVGDTFSFKNQFKDIYITNDAVTTGNCEIIISRGIDIHKLLRITADIIQQGILQQEIAIAITATPIPTTPLSGRINLLVYNDTAETVYIGSSTVTVAGATKGIPVKQNCSMSFTVAEGVILYGIAAIATTLDILEGS
jgi:hypothetical protein